MIKYTYLPNQSEESISDAEHVFARMKQRNIHRLPVPNKGSALVFSSTPIEPAGCYVYLISDEEGIGYFQIVDILVHGVSYTDTAKFKYENVV